MTSFSPTDAAFEGFRLTREQPRAVLLWAACYLAFTFLLGLVALFTLGDQAQTMTADLQRAANDPQAFSAMAQKMAPFFLIGLPFSIVFQGVFTAAVYRAILRPQDSRFGFLRFGFDEARLMAVNLLMALAWGILLFAVLLVAGLSASMATSAGGSIAAMIGEALTGAAFAFAIVALVRLSLAGPITFSEGRFRIFESWGLTRGRFWRLLGAYLLAFALGAVAFFMMLLIVAAALQILAKLSGLPLEAFGATSTNPLLVALEFVMQIVSIGMLTCFYVILKAPAAQAYKVLTH